MNILIPHSWLLEHLETAATPFEIQKFLSLSGPSVERISEIEGEPVYDIEVTTNRVDSMSVRGIAREAAVILTQAGIPSKVKPLSKLPAFMTKSSGKKSVSLPLPQIQNDPELVGRIMYVVLSNAGHVSAPEWMQLRLRQIGINTHDALIDITNYVTHDLGHPCHAFDYDRIIEMGGKIKVVKAERGKKFVTLDGETHRTVGGEVVFENDQGQIIDLPGIKGTDNTGITSSTTNVLFWIESVDPKAIRFASMTHAIRTVAAQLNEKGVDPELIPVVFAKGIELFSALTGAKANTDTFMDIYPGKRKLPAINLPLSRIEEYLGVKVEIDQMVKMLVSLGCEVKPGNKTLRVQPPSWRPDMAIPEDAVEEIARLYGYHNLPSSLMSGDIPLNRPRDTNFGLEHETKLLLAALGGNEVYTYSLIGESTAKLESSYVLSVSQNQAEDLEKTHLKLNNPLTEDMVYLRRTLWTSHIPILKTQSPPFVFELANTYIPSSEPGTTLPTEELHLTLSTTKAERHLKGVLDALLKSVYLPPVKFDVKGKLETWLFVSEIQIGRMLMFPDLQLTVIDLDWKTIVASRRKYPLTQSIPKVSPIIEDMTFEVPKGILVQDIILTLKAVDPLIHKIEFLDAFKHNLSFRIYFQPKEEMNAAELSPLRKKLISTMEAKFGAKMVGKL